ncbi:MAG: hypothetical protein D6820_02780 [Lentisphaerae bacterium]|nr:MAG: hypothetical protein D6820_02780 [Lentisphaerota bacterium]
MSVFSADEYPLIELYTSILSTNPFSSGWRQALRRLLDNEYVDSGFNDSLTLQRLNLDPNLELLKDRLAAMMRRIRSRINSGSLFETHEVPQYVDLLNLHLLLRYAGSFLKLIHASQQPGVTEPVKVDWYPDYVRALEQGLKLLPGPRPRWMVPDHLIACHFQWFRSFYFLKTYIQGNSSLSLRLRQQLWNALLGHNLRRYLRMFYRAVPMLNLLLQGEQGTGKQHVAQLLSCCRYIHFEPNEQRFHSLAWGLFRKINLPLQEIQHSMKSPLNEESLAQLPPYTTLYLQRVDQISPAFAAVCSQALYELLNRNELDFSAKSPLTAGRIKLISSISQPFEELVERDCDFRELLINLSNDFIRIPSLCERIDGKREELQNFVFRIVWHELGDEEAYPLTTEVMEVIEKELGFDYPWPGNFEELRSCIYRIIMRRHYEGLRSIGRNTLERAIMNGELSADEIVSYYTTAMYDQVQNYQEVARRLHIDRRTVKSKINYELYQRFNPDE